MAHDSPSDQADFGHVVELLRRALLIGCLLPGFWLLRLATLEPLLSVVPVDFAVLQKEEAVRVSQESTEEQRRRAAIPLPVYIEEMLQYNVFSASGPTWDRLLQGIDDPSAQGAADLERRRGPSWPDAGPRPVFFRQDEESFKAVLDKLAAGGGVTYVSFSRPGVDRHYRVERRNWTREDFRPGMGFAGRPSPPAFLMYPFRTLGLSAIAAGVLFFALLSGSTGRATRGPSVLETAAIAGALVFFALPLVLVGGSVQALTRAPWLTVPCWILAAAGIHLFAGPGRNTPVELPARSAPVATRPPGSIGLREGLVFLAVALGPLVFLVSASFLLWNR